jgi:hypothetical protein
VAGSCGHISERSGQGIFCLDERRPVSQKTFCPLQIVIKARNLCTFMHAEACCCFKAECEIITKESGILRRGNIFHHLMLFDV